MNALATFDSVARIRDRLRDLGDRGDADAALGAEILGAWAAGEPPESRLNLAPSWRSVVRQREQEAALQAIVRGLSATDSISAAARVISRRLRNYEGGDWPGDKYAGRPTNGSKAAMFRYLSAGGATSARSIRRLLAGQIRCCAGQRAER